jgi:tRNA nucleotidyltransferase (CCA-adding enzyme)
MTVQARAEKIANAVLGAGGRLYMVGGGVRDLILGATPKDYDFLVTGVPLIILTAALEKIPDAKVDAVGKSFGVLKVTIEGETFDVALPRTERSTGTGHSDFEINSDPDLSVEEDLARRDFTMNAIAVEVPTGIRIDPFGGQSDIEQRRIRAVGVPAERFGEDPLRMLRAIRFSSKLDFMIEPRTIEGIMANAPLLQPTPEHVGVAKERVAEEMSRLLMGQSGAAVLRALMRMVHFGLMQYVIPEFMPSVGFEQKNHHHIYTVDQHVFKAVEHAVNRGASLRARWAVLLHDIAKPSCFKLDEKGGGHFYEHEEKGAVMATEILTRLKFSNDFVMGVSKIVAEHLRPQSDSTDRVLRRYVARMGELSEDGMMCREADLFAHAPQHSATAEAVFVDFRQRIAGFKEITGFNESKLALRGDVIAKEFGFKGREIGDAKKMATSAVVEGLVANEEAALLAWLKAHAVAHIEQSR